MRKALAVWIWVGLAGSCGAQELDIGGVVDGGADKRTRDAPFEPRIPVTNSTELITHQRNALTLRTEGPYLYWNTDELVDEQRVYEIRRCQKIDCAGSVHSVFRTGFAFYTFLLQNGRVYFEWKGGIASCAVDSCSTPTVVIAQTSGPPLFIDETSVYWGSSADNAFLSCALGGCAQATVAATGVSAVQTYAVDNVNLYWSMPRGNGYVVVAWRKDGIRPLCTEVASLGRPAALLAHDNHLFFADIENGRLGRSRIAACPSKPEFLTLDQYFPRNPVVDGDVLFWINEVLPPEELRRTTRPGAIMSCLLPECASTVAILDETTMGSIEDPTSDFSFGSSLVVDDTAVYYFANVTPLVTFPATPHLPVEVSIRRLARPKGR